jgi:hypothetical protein
MQYPGAGGGRANTPTATRTSHRRSLPSAISPSVSHQFMIGCARSTGRASRNALLDLLEG